jgi:RNA polymerase sigma-70 factor (ECF subfamily)
MVDGDPDASLVARGLGGEVDAFEPLVARYQRPLYNVALRMLGDAEEARDVVQDAFLKAYEKLSSFDPRYRFFSWVYRIVVNESLNVRARRHPAYPLKSEPVAFGGPEQAVLSRESSEGVHAALQQLPAGDRQLLLLRHFAELSYAEIGDALGIPEKTVKSRLHEARQRLGRLLLHRGSIPWAGTGSTS